MPSPTTSRHSSPSVTNNEPEAVNDDNVGHIGDTAKPDTPPTVAEPDPNAPSKPSKKQRPAEDLHLPLARVQKIIKADKDIPIVAKEATLLISLATEKFITKFIETAQRKATGVTVQYQDVASAAREHEFRFLEELYGWMPKLLEDERKKVELRKQKRAEEQQLKGGTGKDKDKDKNQHTIDNFVTPSSGNVVTNEDGTLTYEDDDGDEDDEMA